MRRTWEDSPWSFRPAAYVVAIGAWAALGVFYLPILSMVLTPLWMVLVVSVVPRRVRRAFRGHRPP